MNATMPDIAATYALPEFGRGELARIKDREFSAVVILDVGGRLVIGTTDDPRRFARHYGATKAPCRIVAAMWTAGPPLARRIARLAEETLADRRVAGSGRFDVPLSLAVRAVELAADKIGAGLRSTAQVQTEIDEEIEREIEAQIKAVLGAQYVPS